MLFRSNYISAIKSEDRGMLDNSVKVQKLTPNIKLEDSREPTVKFDIDDYV